MPYGWVDPAVFMVYRDVCVYHMYKNDSIDSPVRQYWYTLDRLSSAVDGVSIGVFDVRDLPKIDDLTGDEAGDHARIIAAAIDAGHFDDWELGVVERHPKDRLKGMAYQSAFDMEAGASYLKDPLPAHCPFCGARTIQLWDAEDNDWSPDRSVVCTSCRRRWLEVYTLQKIEADEQSCDICGNDFVEGDEVVPAGTDLLDLVHLACADKEAAKKGAEE